MSTQVLDPGVSTFDIPQVVEPAEDLCLATLRNARDRIKGNWTDVGYFSHETDNVCSIGALFVVDVDEKNIFSIKELMCDKTRDWHIERYLSNPAKEALRYLDSAATLLFPDTTNAPHAFAKNPIEKVNQELGEVAVLETYDKAIEIRKAEI